MSLEHLFYPKNVAVIGSMTPGKLGSVLLEQLVNGGFTGELYAVNPKAAGAHSVTGFDSMKSIDKPVDLAIIASPVATIPSVMEDCGEAGVKAAVVITAGFSEIGNHEGEKELLRLARKYDIRFVGPNCAGIANPCHNLHPTLEWRPPAGEVAFISQSGALAGVVTAWAAEQDLGMSKFVSYGNGADLSQVELLHYLRTDPETKVVALYLESVREGRSFMEALRLCCQEKPVVVIKAGRTGVGKRATASHTGSMAGADAVYDAAIRQSGAIRVNSVEEMLDLCKGFVSTPPVKGKKVFIVTNSGGPGVLAADYGEEVGLEIAEPDEALKQHLGSFLSPNCSLKNPVDLTVEGTEEEYRDVLIAALKDFDAALALNVCPPYKDAMSHARGVLEAVMQSGKPVVANFLPNQVVHESVDYLSEHGIANYASGEKAMGMFARMSYYYLNRQDSGGERQHLEEIINMEGQSLPVSGQMLEPEAMGWLRDNGFSVPEFRFAETEKAAVEACGEIGYPVVMKVVSPEILHKSDFGGVVVNIQNDEEAKDAFNRISKGARGKDLRGVVIYPMVRQAQEVLIGLSNDPQFGPVVAFGMGGIYTEIMKDISLRVAPIDKREAGKMIREIRSVKLLQGARGAEPCDLDSLAEMLALFSELPFRYPEISEMDLNPVFLMPDGLLIGDVRVIRKDA